MNELKWAVASVCLSYSCCCCCCCCCCCFFFSNLALKMLCWNRPDLATCFSCCCFYLLPPLLLFVVAAAAIVVVFLLFVIVIFLCFFILFIVYYGHKTLIRSSTGLQRSSISSNLLYSMNVTYLFTINMTNLLLLLTFCCC